MALQARGGYDFYPPIMVNNTSNVGSFGAANVAVTFDSATDRIAWVGNSPVTDVLTDVYFRVGSITSAPNVDVRVETVNLSAGQPARPSGTLWSTNTDKVITISGANTWQRAQLTAGASLTRGDLFAINIVHSSGTANFQIMRSAANIFGTGMWPLCLQDTGTGTWTQLASNLCMILVFQNAGVVCVPGMWPTDVGGSVGGLASGFSPNEVALKIQMQTRKRCVGMHWCMSNVAVGASFSATLWPANSTTDADRLARCTVNGSSVINTTNEGQMYLFFDTAVTLEPGSTYYAGLRAESTNMFDVFELRAPSSVSNAMKGFPIPATCHKAHRTWSYGTAGAWTDTVLTLPLIGLLFDQEEDGAGSGGGGGGSSLRVIGA